MMLQNDTNARLNKALKINLSGSDVNASIIDITHQHVHDGEFFTSNYEELAIANNGVARLRITTGANYCHLIINGEAEGKFRFKTYSGTTYTGAGTLPDATKLTVFNRKTDSVIAPTTIIRHTPTVNVLGTLRGLRTIFGGTGPQSTGGGDSDRVESLIAPNTDVLIVMTNVSGSAQDLSVVLEWYE